MIRWPRGEDWGVRLTVLTVACSAGWYAHAAEREAERQSELQDWRDYLSVPLLSEWRDAPHEDPFEAEAEECPVGAWCDPVRIDALDFEDHRTTLGGVEEVDHYGCDPGIDASGPEVVYELTLDGPSVVRATVDSPEFVDVDLNLMTGLGPGGCRARGDASLSLVLPAGHYWLAVDSYVDRNGEPQAGDFTLQVTQTPLPAGRCAMAGRQQTMLWPSCADGFDCTDGEGVVQMLPAIGPVAREAHLATTADFAWPMGPTQGLENHYRATERASGYVMDRKEPWAPSSSGGPYARGSFGKLMPPLAETWYVNMFWKNKPFPGEKMILYNPRNGRAVVAAAGYETGPRSNEALGGATEEIHNVLGTRHLSELVMGYAADQSLSYGPLDCAD